MHYIYIYDCLLFKFRCFKVFFGMVVWLHGCYGMCLQVGLCVI